MKKNLSWIFIRLICVACGYIFCNNPSYSQQLWGTTSDGGGKKTGGNIFSIYEDGTGFTERFQFLHDAGSPISHRLLNYGDGYLYGAGGNGLFRHHFDGSGYEILYVFEKATGTDPASRLLKGVDGYLYGTTYSGGNNGNGVIYKVKKDGTAYQVLHHFTGVDGNFPLGHLIQLNSGLIFGTTDQGGNSNLGTIYSIHPDGTGFQSLKSFNGSDGANPQGGLLSITINNVIYLYGVTAQGGTSNNGVIYRIKPDGTNYLMQYNFYYGSGSSPRGPLLNIGNIFYGVTHSGGIYSGGVLFKYDPVGNSYQILWQFFTDANANSYFANGPLLDVGGVLYGTTQYGGSNYAGFLYRIKTDGSGYQVLHEFDGKNADDGNLLLANNQIYGLTGGGINPSTNEAFQGTVYRINPNGTAYETLHDFTPFNGYSPSGSLIRGKDGKLYGLASAGGFAADGEAFSIMRDGSNYTPLSWISNDLVGGPTGSLIQATNGNFYGVKTSSFGNTFGGDIFQMAVGLLFTGMIHYDPFCLAPGCADAPLGSLLQATDGKLYGTTSHAGANNNNGTIFRINTNGTGFTILKTFNGADGANPAGSLIQAADGRLYGTTENGGVNGFGTIFRIKTDGTGFQKLFEFGTVLFGSFGAHPKGSLLVGSDGKLYGMASGGGSAWDGSIFRINSDGSGCSVVFNFNSNTGHVPVASLIEDASNGYLFGMTEQGGTSNYGTIFKVKKDGTGYQTLLNFNGANGKYPKGDLLIVNTRMPVQPSPTFTAQKNSGAENNSIKIDSNISVYPNPATQSFNIRFKTNFQEQLIIPSPIFQGKNY